MTIHEIPKRFNLSFDKPAIYKIEILGELNQKWSKSLGDVQISVTREGAEKPKSTLVGQVKDQAALSGILNALYEMHMPVISVKLLKDSDD